MKLMISSGVFYPRAGGAESLFRDLSRLFVEAGNEVTVITRRVDGTPEESVLDGVRIRRFDYPVPYERFVWGRELGRWPAMVRAVHRELRTGGIDTVCIGLLDMSALFLLLLKPIHRFRLVNYLHGG